MLADLDYGCESHFIDRQRWLDLPSPLDEKLNRAIRCQRCEILRHRWGMQLLLRKAESIDIEQPFGLEVEALSRGHHDRDVRRVRKNSGHQIGSLKYMLEVIKHKQHVPFVQCTQQLGAQV